jgi:eukaryotic-like serine/threonine-protein kinase
VALQADGDATGWRGRVRDPAIWKDEAVLFEVVDAAPFPKQSAALLLAVEAHSNAPGEIRVAFLKRVHERHPRDFWINFRLGVLLTLAGKADQAVGYYQAALAIRPGVAVIHNNLGSTLTRTNRRDEAIGHYRQAVALEPSAGAAHLNLAVGLCSLGRKDEALRELPVALRLNPRSAVFHTFCAKFLEDNNRHGEALALHRQAVAIDPKYTDGQRELRAFLIRQGRLDDARVAWEKALDESPPRQEVWYGYAELCLFLGREEEYLRARRALLSNFGATTDPVIAERMSRACLLRPASGEELRRVVDLAGIAGSVEKARAQGYHPSFQFVQGLGEYRQGRLDAAISLMRGEASGVPGPSPRLVLAMALHQKGLVAEARKTLSEAIMAHDWRPTKMRGQDDWICHVLRREAEAMISPDPSALPGGNDKHIDNDERPSP